MTLLSFIVTPIGTILLLLTLKEKEPLEYTPQQLRLKWILGSIILIYFGYIYAWLAVLEITSCGPALVFPLGPRRPRALAQSPPDCVGAATHFGLGSVVLLQVDGPEGCLIGAHERNSCNKGLIK